MRSARKRSLSLVAGPRRGIGCAPEDPILHRGSVLESVLHPVYEIDTPENVRFHVERAGLASRAVAWSLDVLIMGCLIQAGALLLAPLQLLAGQAATALSLVAAFLVQWWYAALCEWRFAGRTLGKWIVGIAARDQRGLRLTLLQTTVRNLLRVIDLVPGVYLVGGVVSLLDPHGRRLGDDPFDTAHIRSAACANADELPAALGDDLGAAAREAFVTGFTVIAAASAAVVKGSSGHLHERWAFSVSGWSVACQAQTATRAPAT
jgi:uncharacterized RDD family membrane protein YckC